MKITFGMHLDGSRWSNKQGTIGEIRTGPSGLLNIIEGQLGLTKPSVHPAIRISEYMDRISEINHESMWFHSSFIADPWSTSKQLLSWRDELVEAGLSRQMCLQGSPRLKCLNSLEKSDLPLSEGRPERLHKIINSLKKNMGLHISSIYLIEPLAMLPLTWQNLFHLLANNGIAIIDYNETSSHPTRRLNTNTNSPNNLKLVQGALSGTKLEGGLSPSDDSLILLSASNEWEAAQLIAIWLKSKPEVNDNVGIICGMDTHILDQALQSYNLPTLGRSTLSSNREIHQILPLVLAKLWEPIDINLLVELLSLNTSIFPSWVCGYLLRAISKEPGVAGMAWNEELDKIYQLRESYLLEQGDKNPAKHSKEYVEEIHSLLVEDRYSRKEGIPGDKLYERCQKLIDILAPRLDEEPVFREVANHARELGEISKKTSSIYPTTLSRMLESVIGSGSISYDKKEEASLWRVYDHPGQIVDSYEEIIWWGFNDNTGQGGSYWTIEEIRELTNLGVMLEDKSTITSIESLAWNNGFTKANSRFIGISIDSLKSEEVYHHPYFDEILCTAISLVGPENEDFARECILRSSTDYYNTDTELLGRENPLRKVSKLDYLPVAPTHKVPFPIEDPSRLSFSSMKTMIECPFRWVLQYKLKLYLPENQTIPTGNQMIGNLCHRIVEEIYKNKSYINEEEAALEAGKLYDKLILSMASELLLEGKSLEKTRYKTSIVNAVRLLVKSINKYKLTVETTEGKLESEVEFDLKGQLTSKVRSIPFIGYADLLLSDKAGKNYVLDLKWTSSSNYRRNEIKEGEALQLASYSWLLKSTNHLAKVSSGYFMLAQGELLSDSPSLTDDVIESDYPLAKVWDMGLDSMKDVISQFEEGFVEARGIIEYKDSMENGIDIDKVSAKNKAQYQEGGRLYQKPPCSYCDFTYLCGLEGGSL